MTNIPNDKVIGDKPILQLDFHYDEVDEEIKPHLVAEDDDQEVEQSQLTPKEKTLLKDCENAIEDALSGFYAVGLKLRVIKVQKLFRETHRSFHQYCVDKFGFGRSYANRSIAAAKCVDNLKSVPIGTVSIPTSEGQARVVGNLAPAVQVSVAAEVKENIGNREPTTKDFENARNKVIPAKGTTKAKKLKAGNEKTAGADVIPMTPPPPTQSFVLPSEFYKGRVIASLRELSQAAITLGNIDSNPIRGKERDELLLQLKKWLPLYAEWEQAGFGAVLQQEAA